MLQYRHQATVFTSMQTRQYLPLSLTISSCVLGLAVVTALIVNRPLESPSQNTSIAQVSTKLVPNTIKAGTDFSIEIDQLGGGGSPKEILAAQPEDLKINNDRGEDVYSVYSFKTGLIWPNIGTEVINGEEVPFWVAICGSHSSPYTPKKASFPLKTSSTLPAGKYEVILKSGAFCGGYPDQNIVMNLTVTP